MSGIIAAIVAGAAMSFQGVMNTRLSNTIGMYESNVFVQGTAFVLGIVAMLVLGKGDILQIMAVDNKVYLLGGVLGLVITITVMMAIQNMSPTYAISTILISQLLVAAVIDAFGWLGSEKVPFTWNKYAGVALMIAGVVLFKWRR
ncbi:MAG: DMT family transporter [Firmicutes bacterium]|nr:DMT family transporter [Bacillota bacterium]